MPPITDNLKAQAGQYLGIPGVGMSGKMNWERVRVENLALAHGSEWANPPEIIVDDAGVGRKPGAGPRTSQKP